MDRRGSAEPLKRFDGILRVGRFDCRRCRVFGCKGSAHHDRERFRCNSPTIRPDTQHTFFSYPGLPVPACGQVGQEKPHPRIAEINRYMGGWQAGTPRQDGFDEDAHRRTSQPHSLADALSAYPKISAAPSKRPAPPTVLRDMDPLPRYVIGQLAGDVFWLPRTAAKSRSPARRAG